MDRIDETIAEFWRKWLSSVEDLARVTTPFFTIDRSYDPRVSHMAQALQAVARAVRGEAEESERGAVAEACELIVDCLWKRPGLDRAYPPERWWESPLGWLVAQASMWAQGDDLVTIAEASELSGWSTQRLSQAIKRRDKRLTVYRDPRDNPQRARRLSKREVLALAGQ